MSSRADLDDDFIFPVGPGSAWPSQGSLLGCRLHLTGDQHSCDWVDGVSEPPLRQGTPLGLHTHVLCIT